MDNLIQCDRCKNIINPKNIKIYDTNIGSGIQARLWNCTHCNEKHLITVMDKTARRMMKDNKEDREKIGMINKVAIHQRSVEKLNLTQAQYNIKRVEQLEKSIADRTKKLDDRMQGLVDKYNTYIK